MIEFFRTGGGSCFVQASRVVSLTQSPTKGSTIISTVDDRVYDVTGDALDVARKLNQSKAVAIAALPGWYWLVPFKCEAGWFLGKYPILGWQLGEHKGGCSTAVPIVLEDEDSSNAEDGAVLSPDGLVQEPYIGEFSSLTEWCESVTKRLGNQIHDQKDATA